MPLCGRNTVDGDAAADGPESQEARNLAGLHAPQPRPEGVVQPPEHAPAGRDRNLAQRVLVRCAGLESAAGVGRRS